MTRTVLMRWPLLVVAFAAAVMVSAMEAPLLLGAAVRPQPSALGAAPAPTISPSDLKDITNQFEFLQPLSRVVFDACLPEFNECLPALQAANSTVVDAWMTMRAPCAERWCTCLPHGVYTPSNQSCKAAASTTQAGMCSELIECWPLLDNCAMNFTYLSSVVPAQCAAFRNCSASETVVRSAYDSCVASWSSSCYGPGVCRYALWPVTVLGGDSSFGSSSNGYGYVVTLSRTLQVVWFITAAFFVVAVVVSIAATAIARRHRRDAMRRALEADLLEDDVVVRLHDSVRFFPVLEGVVPGPTSSCAMCGAHDTPYQLLPCRHRWCGCAARTETPAPSSPHGSPQSPASPTVRPQAGRCSCGVDCAAVLPLRKLYMVDAADTGSVNAGSEAALPACTICLSEPCTVAILPCGHVPCCVACAAKLRVPVARPLRDEASGVINTVDISVQCPLCRRDTEYMVELTNEEIREALGQPPS